MKTILCYLILLAFILLNSGCASTQKTGHFQLPRNLKTRIISRTEHPLLRSGQIIVSESGNDTSLFFALFPKKYSPFIHAGILVFVKGRPYVYEGLGSVPIFMGDTPTDAIKGRIRRRHLNHYLKGENYTAIYDLPAHIDRNKVVEFALFHYKNATPFDPYMDSLDHEKLYCTEFVAQALEAGGSTHTPLTDYRNNRSLKTIHAWLKITDSNVIQAGELVYQKQHVATLSPHRTPREIQLYVAAREELHSRFTKQQRLGNLFEWTGLTPKLRPEIAKFTRDSMRLLEDNKTPSWQVARSAVRQLAVDYFGPFLPDENEQQQSLIKNPALPSLANNIRPVTTKTNNK